MTIDVINTTGKKVETITLPKEIFEVKVNDALIAQALRVFLANQHQGSRSTLTRGEINRTTAKVWRQKGTGRARHGSRRAPIFVGGGVAFGPHPENATKLNLNKTAKKQALLGGLTAQAKNKNIIVIDSVKGFDGKTKTAEKIYRAIADYQHHADDKITLILPQSEKTVLQSTKNLPDITVTQTGRLGLVEVVGSNKLIITKDAIAKLKDMVPAKAVKKEVKA